MQFEPKHDLSLAQSITQTNSVVQRTRLCSLLSRGAQRKKRDIPIKAAGVFSLICVPSVQHHGDHSWEAWMPSIVTRVPTVFFTGYQGNA